MATSEKNKQSKQKQSRHKQRRQPNPAKAFLNGLMYPYQSQLRVALALAVIGVLVFIAQSALFAWVFADWLNAFSQNTPLTSDVLTKALPWLLVCLLVRPWLELAKDNYLNKLSLNIRLNLRSKLLDSLAILGAQRRYYGSDGALSTQVLEQVDALDGYISRYAVQSKVAVIAPLILIVATFFYSPLAAILLLVTAPLVPVFMILVGTAASKRSSEQMQALAQLGGQFLDFVRGMPTLKRLGATDQALTRIDHAATSYQTRTMSVLRLAFLSGAVLELFSSLAIALVAVYLGLGLLGILPWAEGQIPVAYRGALFILLLAPEFYAPLRKLGNDYHAKAEAEAAAAALKPLLSVLNDDTDDADTISPNSKSANLRANVALIEVEDDKHIANDISNNSTAQHADRTHEKIPRGRKKIIRLTDAPTLTADNISIISQDGRTRLSPTSFTLPAGKTLALVGDSGSGKSSLLEAILGFSAFSGTLLINAQDHAGFDVSKLREQFGYLPQTASLLPMSIADNLRLAKPDASDDELIAVLKKVQLWQLISALPKQLDTQLGERGKGISGGQQQRLAIAQLLLTDTKLWLLDEPCAHLDPQTAGDIYQLLGTLSKDKTTVLVSHDLSQVDWIDAICMLSTLKPTQAPVEEAKS